jgi:hypothetical protein
MPTNAQITAAHDALPWYSRWGQNLQDLAAIGGNALSFGGANKVAQMVTGASDQRVADYEHAQRVRAGLLGDAAQAVGTVYGGGIALKAGKEALAGVRAAVPLSKVGIAKGMVAEAMPSGITKMGAAKVAGALGLAGLSYAGRQDPTVNPMVPPTVAPAAVDPVTASLAAGRNAVSAPLTPHEMMLAHLDTLLNRPMTMRAAQAISGMLPAPAKPVGPKETLLGQTGNLSEGMYQADLAAAKKARDAGTIDDLALDKANSKAVYDYFMRNTGLVANPLSFAQANMLPSPDQQEQ